MRQSVRFKDELIALEARQTELERLLSEAKDPQPLIHPGTGELYRRQIASLHEALKDPKAHDQAFELIRSLIDEIRLIPEKGPLQIELRRKLAGILALRAEARQARGPETASLSEQIKLVAGVGFEPTTFRL